MVMLYFVSKITVMVKLKQILIQRLPGLVVKAAVLGAGGRRFVSFLWVCSDAAGWWAAS